MSFCIHWVPSMSTSDLTVTGLYASFGVTLIHNSVMLSGSPLGKAKVEPTVAMWQDQTMTTVSMGNRLDFILIFLMNWIL